MPCDVSLRFDTCKFYPYFSGWLHWHWSNPLQWRQNGRDGVSNHQSHDCLRNRLFGRRSNKTSKLRVTGLCVGNSPGTGEFPTQRASNAENVSIWWRHHAHDPRPANPKQLKIHPKRSTLLSLTLLSMSTVITQYAYNSVTCVEETVSINAAFYDCMHAQIRRESIGKYIL